MNMSDADATKEIQALMAAFSTLSADALEAMVACVRTLQK